MFLHVLFDVVQVHTIWNSVYVMPASQNGGGKPLQKQKNECGKDRASQTSRDAVRVASDYDGSRREQRKL